MTATTFYTRRCGRRGRRGRHRGRRLEVGDRQDETALAVARGRLHARDARATGLAGDRDDAVADLQLRVARRGSFADAQHHDGPVGGSEPEARAASIQNELDVSLAAVSLVRTLCERRGAAAVAPLFGTLGAAFNGHKSREASEAHRQPLDCLLIAS